MPDILTLNGNILINNNNAITAPQESGSPSDDHVRFIDYDGTILYTYSAYEALMLEELPANPTHQGLVAQGWNWTLTEIKNQIRTQEELTITVGQSYTTSSGKTEIDIDIDDSAYLSIDLRLAVSEANKSLLIEWGDETSTTELFSTTDPKFISHTYSSLGEYTISISMANSEVGLYELCAPFITLESLSDSVKSLNIYENYGAMGLIKDIRFGSEIQNFPILSYSNHLTTITIPTTLTDVDKTDCLSYCYDLKAVVLPHGINFSSIDTANFLYLSRGIERLSLPYGMTFIPDYFFAKVYGQSYIDRIDIPYSVTAIGQRPFDYTITKEDIKLPNSIQTIGNYGLMCIPSQKKIKTPSSLISLGNNAFYTGSSVEEVELNEGLTTLGNNVFSRMMSLKRVVFPSTLSSNGTSLFANDIALEEVVFPEGYTTTNTSSMFQYCYSLRSIDLQGITTIGSNMFFECYCLRTISIPEGADSIGADALRGCYSLEEITLPSTITKITARAFYNDRSLKYLDIPSAVTELGASFVANCYSLEYIKFNSSTPPTPAATAFNDLPTSCVIKVPAGSLSTYTATQYYPSSATYVYEEY